MERITIKASTIPKHKREQLARPLLRIVRDAFEDPEIQREFEEWKAKKEKQEAAS